MRTVLLCVALVGLAGAGGYLLASGRARPDAAAPAAAAAPATGGAARGVSEAELRRVVRDELAAGRSGPASAGGAREPAAAAPPPGNAAAFDDGMRRVSRAIAQRTWTRDDAAALGRTIETMSPDQRAAILHSLIPALNRGEIKLAYRGELF